MVCPYCLLRAKILWGGMCPDCYLKEHYPTSYYRSINNVRAMTGLGLRESIRHWGYDDDDDDIEYIKGLAQ